MTEPKPHIVGLPTPRDDVARGLRVKSSEYGDGTVVAVLSIGIQIHWDTPLLGTTDTHLLVHDKSYVAGLERL